MLLIRVFKLESSEFILIYKFENPKSAVCPCAHVYEHSRERRSKALLYPIAVFACTLSNNLGRLKHENPHLGQLGWEGGKWQVTPSVFGDLWQLK